MPDKGGLLKDFKERLNDNTEPGKMKLLPGDKYVIQDVIVLMWVNEHLLLQRYYNH